MKKKLKIYYQGNVQRVNGLGEAHNNRCICSSISKLPEIISENFL